MGTNSSKQKITSASHNRGSNVTINTITTINEEGASPEEKKQKKDKKKGGKVKDKVKVKDGKKDRKKKTKTKYQAGCPSHVKISFDENVMSGTGGGGAGDGASHRNRKKSACPSCDARELLMDTIRSRSGSLRYSDFNKVVRQSRVTQDLEESPMEIFLDGVPEPLPDTVCFICGVYTGSVTRTCQVCCHVYHNGCLQKIGQAMDQHALQLAQMDMWSCHQCSDTSRLLSREETQHAFNCLEGLKIDPDKVCLKNYIDYKQKMCASQGREVTQDKKLAWIGRFNRVTCGINYLDWSQFLQAETISILRNRCKESLVKLMTEMEFSAARKMYKDMMGTSGNTVAMAQVKDRIIQVYLKFRIQLWPEDQDDVASLDQQDFDEQVSWSEFLRIVAIHMVTVRENNPDPLSLPISTPNNGDRLQGNNNNNNIPHSNGVANTPPSSDSTNDEDYRTCDSDLDSPTNAAACTEVASNTNTSTLTRPGHKKNLSDVKSLDESNDDDANRSLSILEDLSRAFNLTGNTHASSSGNQSGQNNNNSTQQQQQQQQQPQPPSHSNTDTDTTLMDESSSKSKSTPEEVKSSAETEGHACSSSSTSSPRMHLWQTPPTILDNPNFTTALESDAPAETAVTPTTTTTTRTDLRSRNDQQAGGTDNKSPMVTHRRSEVLVRPSTEEGRSPRRALSQKLVAPAYGLVDKIQSQDWNC